MEIFLYYLLRTTVVSAILYGFYKILFSKTTFYSVNRITLFIILLTVISMPIFRYSMLSVLLSAPTTVTDIQPTTVSLLVPNTISETATGVSIPWMQILLTLYIGGVMFFSIRYLLGIRQLKKLIDKCKKEKLPDGSYLCITKQDIAPFSWWKHIVISHEDVTKTDGAILAHEKAHIHLHHSEDRVLFELFICLFWFNPFAWLLRSELQSVHEFQADEQVLANGTNTKQYQILLIRKSVSENNFALANSFHQRHLHKRISMMTKQKTTKNRKWSYVMGIPILAVAMVLLSLPKLNAKSYEKERNNDETITLSHSTENEQTNKTFFEYLKKSVNYPKLAAKNMVQGYFTVSYKVDKAGNIENSYITQSSIYRVNTKRLSTAKLLEKEALRVLNSVPSELLKKDEGAYTSTISFLFRLIGDNINSYQPETTHKNTIVVTGYNTPTQSEKIDEELTTDTLVLVDGTEVNEIDLDPANVESVSVYKKGQNRVIFITTKQRAENSNEKTSNFSNAKNPLIVVDGIQQPKEFDITSIPADHIKSVTVLKNEVATKKYGTAGNDGVVEIRLKENVK